MTIKSMFPVLRRTMHGKHLVYLDSAASAQKPLLVTDAVKEFYEKSYANVHRGIHGLAEEATEKYEEARSKVAQLIRARPEEVVFTSGTTQSINVVAWSLAPTFKNGNIVVTLMEHHSNLVPWQQVAKQHGLELRVIPLTETYTLDMRQARELIDENTRIVAVSHVSNVLGTINPIKELAQLAHAHNALMLVDGAQAVPHFQVNVKELDVDFYAFSGHKMYGPTGIGVLYGKKELLEKLDPVVFGGEMVKEVTIEKTTWNNLPWKFEAGTPNIAGAVGLGFAVDFIRGVGYDAIEKHERELVAYMLEKVKIEGLKLIGPTTNRGCCFAFVLEGTHPHDVAALLNDEGVAVRSGHHCTQPLHDALNIGTSTRASLGIYNTKEDIDRLVAGIAKVKEKLHETRDTEPLSVH